MPQLHHLLDVQLKGLFCIGSWKDSALLGGLLTGPSRSAFSVRLPFLISLSAPGSELFTWELVLGLLERAQQGSVASAL